MKQNLHPEKAMDINLGQMVAAATFASAITALAIVVLKPLAKHIGLLDCPSGRKQHEGDIPLIGGIAIFLGLIAGVSYSGVTIPDFNAFVTAVSLLFVVGIIDDFLDVPALIKLIAQLIAALILVFWADMRIEGLSNLFYSGEFDLGNLSVPITIIAVIGYTNAINMSDGIDGLAGSLTLTTTLSLLVAAWIAGYQEMVTYLGVFTASIIIFLVFNVRHPLQKKAGIFLGDSGSLLCGFAVSWFIIYLATIKPRAIDGVTALWIVGVPFIDLTAVMLKRLMRGRSPFSADREHFHHILMVADFSVNQTVGIIFGLSVCFVIIGLTGQYLLIPSYIMFYAFCIIFIASIIVLNRAWSAAKLIKTVKQTLLK